MTKFDSFLKTCDYQLTESNKFGWSCWPKAWIYTAENDYGRVEAVANAADDVIYEVTAYTHKDEKPYRWLNPQFMADFKSECTQRRISVGEAWNSVVYADTESFQDILDKAFAIFHGLNFDEKLVISLDVSTAQLLTLALAAHEKEVSLNDFIIQVVKDATVKTV
jgi:hypothetical protein